MSDTTLRDDLIAVIRGWDLDLEGELRDDTSLIRSGVLDSVALWNLVLWVESKVGAPVDPASFDLSAEWDTVASLVRFVESRRAR